MLMIFMEILQLVCYSVPELPPSRNPFHNYNLPVSLLIKICNIELSITLISLNIIDNCFCKHNIKVFKIMYFHCFCDCFSYPRTSLADNVTTTATVYGCL